MGPTRRSARLADHVVLLGAIAAIPEGVPRRVAQALGGGADLCLALSKSALQQRLRATVHHQRGAYLCRDGASDATEVGSPLSFQTVFSVTRGESPLRHGSVSPVLAVRPPCPRVVAQPMFAPTPHAANAGWAADFVVLFDAARPLSPRGSAAAAWRASRASHQHC